MNPAPATRYVVPAAMLAELLEEAIASLNKTHEVQGVAAGQGGVNTLAVRAAQILDLEPSAVVRRIFDIRHGRQYKTGARIADALLLAVDIDIEQTEIPTLPDGRRAAREMAEVYSEEVDTDLSELETRRLARDLYSFCTGFLYGFAFEPEELIARKEARAS